MRTPVAAVVAALAAACGNNPDPRRPSLDDAELRSAGGWIVVTQLDGSETDGELISVEPGVLRVLAWSHDGIATPRPDVYASRVEARALFAARTLGLVAIPQARIWTARLYCYVHDSFVAWGILGGVSTITHLILLPITLPVWIGATAASETAEAFIDYPDSGLEDMARWARFPQGMPPDLPPAALFPAGPPRARRARDPAASAMRRSGPATGSSDSDSPVANHSRPGRDSQPCTSQRMPVWSWWQAPWRGPQAEGATHGRASRGAARLQAVSRAARGDTSRTGGGQPPQAQNVQGDAQCHDHGGAARAVPHRSRLAAAQPRAPARRSGAQGRARSRSQRR